MKQYERTNDNVALWLHQH